jgi:hypothetical protein
MCQLIEYVVKRNRKAIMSGGTKKVAQLLPTLLLASLSIAIVRMSTAASQSDW